MLLPVALKMQILPLSKSPNSPLLSPDGDTMQRIAAYFTEALADRILKAWPGLHKALNSIGFGGNYGSSMEEEDEEGKGCRE
jgi:hypothetical protein